MKKFKNYEEFMLVLTDEFCYTFLENHAQGDCDGNVDPFIEYTVKALFESGIRNTKDMMLIIEPMLDERFDHLDKLGTIER